MRYELESGVSQERRPRVGLANLLTLSRSTPVAVRLLREELQLLQEPGSYVGEVVKVMGKTKVLVKVQPEGKYGVFALMSG